MKTISNNKTSKHLVLVLHGSATGINSPLLTAIFNGIKNIAANVTMLEFSFIEKGIQKDPEQIAESDEVKTFLLTQKYEKLTVIGHSNGGFVGLVATTRNIQIDHLVLLGLSVRKDATRNAVGEIIKKYINKGGRVTVVQPEQDEYASPQDVQNLKDDFDLGMAIHKTQGNHYFEGFEHQLITALLKTI